MDGIMVKQRLRLNATSIADIGVAERVTLSSAGSGGYTAMAENQYGKEPLRTGGGVATYPTIASAKRAVHRHNPGIPVETVVLPSPSLRPPT
jgi:hypothetical protein